MKAKTIFAAAAGGAIGAALVLVGQGAKLSLIPVQMSFEQWTGILLASVALLVTALGVVIAIAAIWGFSGIKTGAELAAIEHVTEQLGQGELGKRLDAAFTTFMEQRVREDRFRLLLQSRVDEVLFGGDRDRIYADPAMDEVEEEVNDPAVDPNDR